MNSLIKSVVLWVLIDSLVLAPCCLNLRAQQSYHTLENVKQSFERQVTNVHQEKIYVHLDRNTFITGETIWLGAYCVDATFHAPVNYSKVLSVELLDASGTAVKQIRFRLLEGLGSGQIFVSPEIPTGSYTLRAYTNWMKNFDPEFVFSERIQIVNPSSIIKSGATQLSQAPTVDFFPEGGQLVRGLKSKVAVKVVDNAGSGLQLTGIVYDHLDQEVTDFTTSELGYGHFYLTPDSVSRYVVRIQIDSIITKYNLPPAMDQGVSLSVNTIDDGRINLAVEHTRTYPPELYLVVHTRGVIKKLTRLDLDRTNQISFEPHDLPPGIAHITLMNKDFVPLCERLVFIYPDEQDLLSLKLNKQSYQARDKVLLTFTGGDHLEKEDMAHLSVSVSKSLPSKKFNQNIVSYLLLTSDLKGPVDDPWNYFDPSNTIRAEQLDLVMLTHGWRRFDWEQVVSDQSKQFEFLAEINAPILSGQVIDQQVLSKPLQVNFLNKASVMNSIKPNQQGYFHMEVPFRVSSQKVLFFTNNDTLQSDQISIVSPFDLEYPSAGHAEKPFHPEMREFLETINSNIQVSQVYREFNQINGIQPKVSQNNNAFYGEPDHLYLLDDYTRFETVEDLFIEFIRSAVIRDNNKSSGFHVQYDGGLLPGKALTLIDGVPIFDFDYVMNYDPLKVEKIGVVNDVYRMGSIEYSGIVEFTTYRGDFDEQQLPEYIVEKVYHGLQAPRTFYSPDYSDDRQQLERIPDYRNTMYWNPMVKVGNEKNVELEFFTSDEKGTYEIEINGITSTGQPLHIRDSFVVK